MPQCSHIYCKPTPSETPNITYHRFPLTQPAVTKKWTTAMKRTEWEPSPNDYLCSLHFTEFQFFTYYKKKYLKPHAVPTIFQFSSTGELPDNKLPLPKQQPIAQERREMVTTPLTSRKSEFIANKDHVKKKLVAKPIQKNRCHIKETNFPSIKGNCIRNEMPTVHPFSLVQLPQENNVNVMSRMQPLNVVTSIPENNVNVMSRIQPLNVVTSIPENNVNVMSRIQPLNVVTSIPGNVVFSGVPQLRFIQPVQSLVVTSSVPVQSSFIHNSSSLRPILPKPIVLSSDSPSTDDHKDQPDISDNNIPHLSGEISITEVVEQNPGTKLHQEASVVPNQKRKTDSSEQHMKKSVFNLFKSEKDQLDISDIIPHLSDEISVTEVVEQNPGTELHKESSVILNQKRRADLPEQHTKKPVFNLSEPEKDSHGGNENVDQPLVKQNSSIKIKALKTIAELNKLKREKIGLKATKQRKKFWRGFASQHKVRKREKKVPFDHEYSLPSQVNLKQKCEYLMMILQDTLTELKYTRQKLGSRQMKILQQKSCIVNLKEELYRKKKNSRNNYHIDSILDPDLILSGKLLPEIDIVPIISEK